MDSWIPRNMDGSYYGDYSSNLPPRVEYTEDSFQWDSSSSFNSYNPHWSECPPPPYSYHQELYHQPQDSYNFSPQAPSENPYYYEPSETHFQESYSQAPIEPIITHQGYKEYRDEFNFHHEMENDMFQFIADMFLMVGSEFQRMESLIKRLEGLFVQLNEKVYRLQQSPYFDAVRDSLLWENLCQIGDRISELRKKNKDSLLSPSAPVFFHLDEVEEEVKDIDLPKIESYVEDTSIPIVSNFWLYLQTLEPQPNEEERPVSLNESEMEETPQIVLLYDENLDDEDLRICEEISTLVECFFLAECYLEICDDKEPSTSHESSRSDSDMHCIEESEKECVEIFANHDMEKVVDEEKEPNLDDEWYKVEFEEEPTHGFEGKYKIGPSIIFYMRFFTLVEISFFWYRDGYSEPCKS